MRKLIIFLLVFVFILPVKAEESNELEFKKCVLSKDMSIDTGVTTTCDNAISLTGYNFSEDKVVYYSINGSTVYVWGETSVSGVDRATGESGYSLLVKCNSCHSLETAEMAYKSYVNGDVIDEEWLGEIDQHKELVDTLTEYWKNTIQERSFVGEMKNPNFVVSLTDGGVLDSKEKNKDRLNINNEILVGTDKTYSLYERFGPNISFVPYLGESSFDLTRFDYLYSAYQQGKMDKIELDKLSLDTISSTYLGTKTYENRPPVLNEELIRSSGMKDTRVNVMNKDFSIASSAVFGNMMLGISKYIFRLTTVLMGNEFLEYVFNTVEELETTDFWDSAIVIPLMAVITLGMIFAMFSFAKHVKAWVNGKESFAGWGKSPIYRLIEIVACLAICLTLLNTPNMFNKPLKTITFGISNLFDEFITQTAKSDIVNGSESISTSPKMEQALWEKAIFNPWVKGTFGKNQETGEWYDYEHLYTQFATDLDSNQGKLSQDYNEYLKSEDDKLVYDSANATGDVKVSVGGKDIRNWAAFVWSTQSIYHLDTTTELEVDAEAETEEDLEELEKIVSWPYATRTYKNKNIYLDNYRWADALLNVGYGYDKDGNKIINYQQSRPYKPYFKSMGKEALMNSLILLFMMPILVQRIYYFAMISILTITMIFYAVYGLFKENEVFKFWPQFVDNLKHYFLATAKLYVLTIFYINLIGKGLIYTLLFIFMSVLLLSYDLRTLTRKAKQYKQKFDALQKGEDINKLQTGIYYAKVGATDDVFVEATAKYADALTEDELKNIFNGKSDKKKKDTNDTNEENKENTTFEGWGLLKEWIYYHDGESTRNANDIPDWIETIPHDNHYIFKQSTFRGETISIDKFKELLQNEEEVQEEETTEDENSN